ncbi:MAG: sensor histidine kinase [Solirubrobacterales bacterium]|jgi:two-component system sensor histidine kinase UhpB|nr:sensor histidine kinase [Solirubrobacterales bacterium]
MTQVLVVNLLVVVAAVVATMIADLSLSETPEAALVLGLAIALTIVSNLFLLQRRFKPLEDLIDQMERADLSRPGANLRLAHSPGSPEEVERLHHAFIRMLERLEAERRRASSAALEAQEEERARVARDLHDEVNQSLTGLLLRLEAAREKSPPALAGELAEIRALGNQALQELLALARQLRPTALDDLGLKAALASHVTELGRQSGIRTTFEAEGDIASVPRDVQIVAYRVAQEALSNAARHSGAAQVRVRLEHTDGAVELSVADDGRGFTFDQASRGLGLAGMRERALLVNGDLRVESRPEVGTNVRLRVPIGVTNDVRERG